MSAVLVIGGTSSIARAFCARLAARGASLHVTGRDADELDRICRDLQVRFGVEVTSSLLDICDTDSHPGFITEMVQRVGELEGVAVFSGLLGDAARAESDFDHARALIDTNFTGAVSMLTAVSGHLERQGSGFIVVVGSVAGDRGRAGNYVYGSAKAALEVYLQGLRARLFKHGVKVILVKPGFVDTAMIFGRPGLFLVASPERVAGDMLQALDKGRDVIYTPFFWAIIMAAVRAIPEPLFKRLKI